MKEPQTVPVTIVFEVEHVPGNTEHLEQLLINYFEGKGVKYKDGVITI